MPSLTMTLKGWFVFIVLGCGIRTYASKIQEIRVLEPQGSSLADEPDEDWVTEQLLLKRRADEASQAAAEEEYERIKYDLEELAEDSEQTSFDGSKRKRQMTGKMGVSSRFCDDAKHLLESDWDPTDPQNQKDFTCDKETLTPSRKKFDTKCYSQEQLNVKVVHYCMKYKIPKATEPPVIGSHRPLWAMYGEYRYLPWQRWLHNLEHGAVGLLYHKCADPIQVNLTRQMLTSCMRKHIITPYDLPEDKPLALVSWGCYLPLTHFDEKVVFDFIRQHSNRGREHYLERDGSYNELLTVPAKDISNGDKDVCPASKFRRLRLQEAKEHRSKMTMLSSKMPTGIWHDQRSSSMYKRETPFFTSLDSDLDLVNSDLSNIDEVETRKARVSRLERDLERVKQLFFQKIKPLMKQ